MKKYYVAIAGIIAIIFGATYHLIRKHFYEDRKKHFYDVDEIDFDFPFTNMHLSTQKVDDEDLKLNPDDNNIEQWLTVNNRGYVLSGYVHRTSKLKNWIIVVHGYRASDAKIMNRYSELFFDMGYNVLVIDNEGHGNSENNFISMGHYDSENIALWSRIIEGMYPDKSIGLFGVSMGASSCLMSLSEDIDLSDNVKCVVADSGYTNISEILNFSFVRDYNFEFKPIMYLASFVNKVTAGFFYETRSAIKAVENTNTPVLFTHCDEDAIVPVEMANELYSVHKGEKELLIIEGGNHIQGIDKNKELYTDAIHKFVKKHIK